MLTVLCEFCLFDRDTKKLIRCGVQDTEAANSGKIVNALGQRITNNVFSGKDVTLINATVDKVDYLANSNENVTVLQPGGELNQNVRCDGCRFLNSKFPTTGKIIEGAKQQYYNGYVSLEGYQLSDAELYLDYTLGGIKTITNSLITTSYPLSGVETITNSRLIISVNEGNEVFNSVEIKNSYVQIRYNGSNRFATGIILQESEMDLIATVFSASSALFGSFSASKSLLRATVALSSIYVNNILADNTGALETSVLLVNVTLTKQNKPDYLDYFVLFGNAAQKIEGVASLLNVFSGIFPYSSKPSYLYVFNATDASEDVVKGYSAASSIRIDYYKASLMQVNLLRVVDFLHKAGTTCYSKMQCDTKITTQHNADRFGCTSDSDKKFSCNGPNALPLYSFSVEAWTQGDASSTLLKQFKFSDSSSDVAFLNSSEVALLTRNGGKSDDVNTYTQQLLDSCAAPNYFNFREQKCTNLTQTGSATVVEKDKTLAIVALALMVTSLVLLVGAVIFFIFALRKYKRTQSAPQSEERPPSKLQPVRVPSASPAEEPAEVLQVAAQPVDGSALLKQAGAVDFAAEYERLVGK